ncbi:Flr1p [Sugiyamaella lignohabitans]|uniref:Flr1p n=1 Tax=Sugiyamaella lignohabitans TaxID=796027 RepID=A0A161HHH9_9ASCO|nr:Flr1p [Sugiyamaella lignohabitans]ANB15490.1 Flr1p [Sugiyamaella lignohabitans]
MTYVENFRNTLVVDILEAFGLVKLSSNFAPQPETQPQLQATLSNTSVLLDKNGEDNNSSEIPVGFSNAEMTTEVAVDAEKKVESNGIPGLFTPSEERPEPVDPFLVDWNGPNDPEHPHNWPRWKRAMVVFQVMLLSCVTYMGSSIYTPGQLAIQEEFGVGHVVATLNLSIYVLGYGLGPMIFSPLSEEATFGRNIIYMVTLFLFFILQIPAALATNIGGLIVVRFITGVLSSPAISTGGATLGDIVSSSHTLPRLIGAWACGAVAAPGKFLCR